MEKIVLRSIGSNEMAVIKDVRDLLCIDLYKAKEVVEMVKNGDEIEMEVNDAEFAVDILLSSGADACILGIEDAKQEQEEQQEEMNEEKQEERGEKGEYDEQSETDYYEDAHILTGDLLDDLVKCRENLQEGTNISNARFHVLEQIYKYQKKMASAKSEKWFLLVIPFLIVIANLIKDPDTQEFPEEFGMIMGLAFLGSLIVYLFIIHPIQCRRADDKYEDLIRELKHTIPEYDRMIEEWQNTSMTQTCMEFMTEKYWSLDALDSLIALVEGKRAETFKESINLYEDIQHQNRMEAMQQEQLAVSRDTNKRITSIQQTAANTERYAKKAAHSAKVGNVINTVNTVQLHNISKHTKN